MFERRRFEKLTNLFGPLDAETLDDIERRAEWLRVSRGDTLMRQGEPADSLSVLLSGRLRAVHELPDGTMRIVGDIATGESIGEMAFFTGSSRQATVYALRDSLLLRFSNAAFDDLVARNPRLLREVMRVVIERLQRANRGDTATSASTNIAVVPASGTPEVTVFAARLAEALSTLCPTSRLTGETVDRELDAPGVAQRPVDDREDSRLVEWLAEQEERFRFVVYETDSTATEWSARCIRQADEVLIVALFGDHPDPSQIEQRLFAREMPQGVARRTLVLLHRANAPLPSDTRRWLAGRSLERHFHCRLDRDADLARIARALAGTAVGLVLGGGGARGLAHIGIIRALNEARVPTDMIGGTSMGASIAAQAAMGWSWERMLDTNRDVWLNVRPHKDFTVPLLSLLRKQRAAYCGRRMYREAWIEDLWIPYFCISSNLTTASMRVHTRGPLLRAVTASTSLPGIVVPELDERHLLVDGALFNNLPGDVMRKLGSGRTLLSKVTIAQDEAFTYERVPTLGEVMKSRLWFREPPRYPSLMEVVVRAAMLSSIDREQEVVRAADFVFEPPVGDVRLMDFTALDRIVESSYRYATKRLEEWNREGALDRLKQGSPLATRPA